MNDFLKKSAVIILSIFSFCQAFAQITIQEARQKSNGVIVTVEGIIIAGEETSDLRFLQDATGGIALYDGLAGSASVQFLEIGDKVKITGEIGEYQGLKEINKILTLEYISPSNPLPFAKEIDADELGTKYQSELVFLNCSTIETTSLNFSAGEYGISSSLGASNAKLLVNNNCNAIGKQINKSTNTIIGVSYYANNSFLLLRKFEDIQAKACLGFYSLPRPFSINKTNVVFLWESTINVNHTIYVGPSPENLSVIQTLNDISVINYEMKNLIPGTINYMKVTLEKDGETLESPTLPFVTQSNSSGEIEVYFNNEVNTLYSDGSIVNGDQADIFDKRLFELFEQATTSIDIAMYNINRTIIVNYLIDAYNRGVLIRYIADDQTSNSAFNTINPPFGLVYGNQGDPLMHNKFIIIDADVESQAKVIMGSTNFTSTQMSSDPNHMLVIHDQSLAQGYTLEFEEMWGSDTAFPNISNARFGSSKKDNTPHLYNINGISLESYFSPSDQVTDKIVKEINASQNTVDMALLTITKNEIGSAVFQKHNQGLGVRLIVENFDDIGSEFNYFKNAGIPVKTHPSTYIFHHKYCIFDENGAEPRVWTGSHNWTNNAEFNNDENSVLIHDKSIANMFRQEYEARWGELVATKTSELIGVSVYPNPTTDFVYFISELEDINFHLFSITGQSIAQGEGVKSLDMNNLDAGIYNLVLTSNDGQKNFMVIKQ